MSLPRCPRCRSAVNHAWYARCIGCGAEIQKTLPPSRRGPRPVIRQAKQDSNRTLEIFLIFGAFGLLGGIASFANGPLLLLSSIAGLVGVLAVIGRLLSPVQSGTGSSCLQVAGAVSLCLLALVFGLVVMLAFVCMRID